MEQEEMQFIGYFRIYKEAYKLIFTWRNILTKITLSLILPLSLTFLTHEQISEILFWRMWKDEFQLRDTQSETPRYQKLSNLVRSDDAEYTLEVIYFTFVLSFSLLSTSAVVYTIACIYTSREIKFKDIMSVVPRVWKRLIITFLCAFLAFSLYIMLLALALYLRGATLPDSIVGDIVFVIIIILYALGFVYLTFIWQLACLISVLEESYGIKAMAKSKGLIKGKMGVALAIFLKLNLSFFIIYYGFKIYVALGDDIMGVFGIIGCGWLLLMLFLMMILFGLVIQTIIYFICKSYHHENIDKSALSDHLEVFLGDYVPLKAKDVKWRSFRSEINLYFISYYHKQK